MIKAGKIAHIKHEHGKVEFTAEAFADDLVVGSGDHINLKARGKALDGFCQFSGGNIKARKTIMAALVRGEDGEHRDIKPEEALTFTNAKTGQQVNCAIATRTERLRYLGWFTCMDGEGGTDV